MIANNRVYTCSCKVKGLPQSFIASIKLPFVVIADKNQAHLLHGTGWSATKANGCRRERSASRQATLQADVSGPLWVRCRTMA
jgi:hypothetical protein